MRLLQVYRAASFAFASLLFVVLGDTDVTAQTNSSQAVKNIVIVHGAWVDGSSWSKVIPLLQAKGFHVVVVQNPLTSFADDVAATRRVIALQDGPVLLVGHSYAGVVITEAGNDPKVVGLVYVAAFAPNDGESINSVTKNYPPAPLGGELRPDASVHRSETASEDQGHRDERFIPKGVVPQGVAADSFYEKDATSIAQLLLIVNAVRNEPESQFLRASTPVWIPKASIMPARGIILRLPRMPEGLPMRNRREELAASPELSILPLPGATGILSCRY